MVAAPPDNKTSVVVGLAGGICSGKSTVRQLLERRGAAVLDADLLGHRCYEPGSACLEEVVKLFGRGIIGKDGALDRAALGAIVFGDKKQLERLSSVTWPYIRRMIEAEISQHRANVGGVMVVEAAVLVEAGWHDLFDEVWVAIAPPEVARARLAARNGLSAEEAAQRVAAQAPNEQRVARASVVLENGGSREALEAAVEARWSRLRRSLGSGKPLARL